jgi:hypothetical protein
MSATEIDSLLDQLPPPPVIHRHMGRLYRELTLLRRLLRLSQSARKERSNERPEPLEVRGGR